MSAGVGGGAKLGRRACRFVRGSVTGSRVEEKVEVVETQLYLFRAAVVEGQLGWSLVVGWEGEGLKVAEAAAVGGGRLGGRAVTSAAVGNDKEIRVSNRGTTTATQLLYALYWTTTGDETGRKFQSQRIGEGEEEGKEAVQS